jgi:membrane protein involved in colicin uptake
MDSNQTEQTNRKKGMAFSLVVHIIAFSFFFIRSCETTAPGGGGGGGAGSISINFGDVESAKQTDEPPTPPQEVIPKPEVNRPEPKDRYVTSDNDNIAIKQDKKKDDKKDTPKKTEEELRREREQADALAEAKRLEDMIKGMGGAGSGPTGGGTEGGGGGGGPGKGPGTGGGTGGGSGGGFGNVRGPLAGRGVKSKCADIKDFSQREGVVIVKVCVDRMGKVTKANATQSGSTINDAALWKLCENCAKEYTFKSSSSGSVEQCGEIVFDFRLTGG